MLEAAACVRVQAPSRRQTRSSRSEGTRVDWGPPERTDLTGACGGTKGSTTEVESKMKASSQWEGRGCEGTNKEEPLYQRGAGPV